MRLCFLRGNLGLGFAVYSGKWVVEVSSMVGPACCMSPSLAVSGRRSFVGEMGWRVVESWEVFGIVVALVVVWPLLKMFHKVASGVSFVARWVCRFVETSVFATKTVHW